LRLIFEKQWLHACLLAVLLFALAWSAQAEPLRRGELWGISTLGWLWIAVGLAVAHQIYVWFCWRTQLHRALLTRAFGASAFPLYAAGFATLGIARVAAVFVLALANRDTLAGDITVLRILAVVALLPALYLFYSVKRYFTFTRALGVDHFDPAYRSAPLVRQGIFRFTRNGMYVFGFLLFWVPGLWFASAAALCAALFNHAYIWIHYYSTELPDMRRIYGFK
jgi:protein-S-isoprenylcysteine O-methyltransferase Ste14